MYAVMTAIGDRKASLFKLRFWNKEGAVVWRYAIKAVRNYLLIESGLHIKKDFFMTDILVIWNPTCATRKERMRR
jgi:hypothetical protein